VVRRSVVTGVSALAVIAVVAAAAGLHRVTPKPSVLDGAPPGIPAPSWASLPLTRLPEDAAAGLQSQLQWREHMAREEEERQLTFDRQRLDEHRAVAKLFASCRARYDRAETEAAVRTVRAEMPRRLAEIQARVKAIDHWGNNSRLLGDYEALSRSLSDGYADARVAAIQGDARAQERLRSNFDEHMKTIAAWLDKVAEGEDEDE
jgi:hypothetical protein